MSLSKPIVAIAGATGNLGPFISRAFLQSPFSVSFSKVLILTRSPDSPAAAELKDLGAHLVKLDADTQSQNLSTIFEGVDIFINAVGPGKEGEGHKTKVALMEAAAHAGVKVYFPSEFGIDHRSNDFQHVEWGAKASHQAKARASGMKVVSVYPSLFMEDSFGPWFGFDTQNKHWTIIGSAKTKVSFTAKQDIASCLASLSLLAVNSPETVPNHVRIAGDTVSMEEAKGLMESESGDKIDIEELDLNKYKTTTIETQKDTGNPSSYLRFLMGSGSLDHSIDCFNEIANPNESIWKWKSVKQYAEETKGRPWCS